MESNPGEAITNNVLGTRNLLAAAEAAGVERFVMISTDVISRAIMYQRCSAKLYQAASANVYRRCAAKVYQADSLAPAHGVSFR